MTAKCKDSDTHLSYGSFKFRKNRSKYVLTIKAKNVDVFIIIKTN